MPAAEHAGTAEEDDGQHGHRNGSADRQPGHQTQVRVGHAKHDAQGDPCHDRLERELRDPFLAHEGRVGFALLQFVRRTMKTLAFRGFGSWVRHGPTLFIKTGARSSHRVRSIEIPHNADARSNGWRFPTAMSSSDDEGLLRKAGVAPLTEDKAPNAGRTDKH